jgi:hypothetical protein
MQQMTSIEPALPSDWMEQAIGWPSAGPDSRWQDNARELLRKHGSAALVVADVQELVRSATDGSTRPILSEQRIARIPEPGWAVRQVWRERGTADCLWSATEDLLSIDAELSVLDCLGANGFVPVKDATKEARDWTLTKEGRACSIEVKAKGELEAKLDYVHRAYVGQQLVDQSDFLRRCRVNTNLIGDALERARPSQLHWLAKAISSTAPLIAEKMPQTWQEAKLDLEAGSAALLAMPMGWRLKLKSPDGWRIDLSATMDSVPWSHDHLRPNTGHAVRRLSREHQEDVAYTLSTHVCSDEAQFKKSDAMYVVVWPTPSTWDDTLADNEEVVDGILDAMTRELEDKRAASVPLALWGQFVGRSGGSMRLNSAAEALLGAKTIATRASV